MNEAEKKIENAAAAKAGQVYADFVVTGKLDVQAVVKALSEFGKAQALDEMRRCARLAKRAAEQAGERYNQLRVEGRGGEMREYELLRDTMQSLHGLIAQYWDA